MGLSYYKIIVPYHNCIQSLDILELVQSTRIQRLNATVTQYRSCTTDFSHLMILDLVDPWWKHLHTLS